MTGNGPVRRNALCLYVATLAALGAVHGSVLAEPTGGRIVAGSGAITAGCNQTSIQQDSARLVIDWRSFSTRPNESVSFSQPGASAIALNRVTGQNPSVLLGSLSANGQVFIVNPNGVIFGTGSRVNVGGLVASTLNVSNSDFLDGRYTFAGDSRAGPVVNFGVIRAAPGGYVALIGPHVVNAGAIVTPGGVSALAAGSRVTVTLGDHRMVGLSVDQGVLDALASNHGLIQADGGQAWLAANAEDALLAGVVNNTGVIQARSAVNQNGVIRLVAAGGTVDVGGVLDASAPTGGAGGSITTAGARVQVAPAARISTAAPNGKTGSWTIAADTFDVAAGGGNMTGATLARALALNNVGVNAVFKLDDALAWNAPTTLTLASPGSIALNAPILAPSAVLALNAGGAVTQQAAIQVAGLALLGSNGAYRLENASNRIGTVAANTGSVVLADGVPLDVGTVAGTRGVTTSGATTLSAPTITLNAPVTSQSAGLAVTLVGPSGFINTAGPAAVNTPDGRWVIASGSPDADVFDGLASGNLASWGDPSGTAAAAQSGNRYAFAALQQVTLSIQPIEKPAGTSRALTPADVSIALRYTGANYGGAFADSPSTHAPLYFTLTSSGATAGAAAGDYTLTLTPVGAWPGGYSIATFTGTLRVTGSSVPSTPVAPDNTPTSPEASPEASLAAIDSAQTLAAQLRDEQARRASLLLQLLSPEATPIVRTTGDDRRLPADAWPGKQCRM